MPARRVRIIVPEPVAELAVGGDHGGEPVAVGVWCVRVTGADRAPVGGGDLGAAGARLHAEHRVGVLLIGTHGAADGDGRDGSDVLVSRLIAV